MPMNVAVFLGLGAIALLAMAGKKRKPPPEEKEDKLPPPPEPDEDENKPPPEPDVQHILVMLEDYRLPEGRSLPEGLTDQQWRENIWISGDCKAWALGKQFKGKLSTYWPEFYDAYVDLTMQQNPDLALVPPGEWVDFQFVDQEMTEGIVEDPYKVAVAKILLGLYGGEYADCVEKLPEASDFSSGEAYRDAWIAFADEHKNFYALFYNLAIYAEEHMLALYQQRFPEAAEEWMEREWAYEAVYQEGLNEEDMTDWAYHHAYPRCPEVIDQNNPEHQECMQAWLRLRDYVREYL